jgi:hypothetical protein
MCTQWFVRYTCGCVDEEQFVQCEALRGTYYKCNPLKEVFGSLLRITVATT